MCFKDHYVPFKYYGMNDPVKVVRLIQGFGVFLHQFMCPRALPRSVFTKKAKRLFPPRRRLFPGRLGEGVGFY